MKQSLRAPALVALLLLLIVGGIGSSYSEAAKVYYRWIDGRGDPVHSDRPPPEGTDYEVISTQSSLVRSVSASEGAVPAEVEPRVGNEFEPATAAEPESRKNPAYCERARENLKTLNERARIRVRNDQGEFHFLDEAEKEARREQARAAIETYCE